MSTLLSKTQINRRDQSRITCSRCDTQLVADGIRPDELIRCANCGATFFQDARPYTAAKRKAILSFVLGLLTPCGSIITAIPSVLLGMAALRETKKQPRAAGTRSLAIAGISLSLLFVIACNFVFGGAAFFALWTSPVAEADEIMALAKQDIEFELPDGFVPVQGSSFFGTNTSTFIALDRGGHCFMQFLPGEYQSGQSVQTAKRSIALTQRGSVSSESIVIAEPFEVTKQVRTDDRREHISYFMVVERKRRVIVVVMTVGRNFRGTDSQLVTEREVLDFFQSITFLDDSP